MTKKPQWVIDKEALRNVTPETIIVVGKMGVAGVIDGKLPSGETYHRNKRQHR
jgi:hypothetical protein